MELRRFFHSAAAAVRFRTRRIDAHPPVIDCTSKIKLDILCLYRLPSNSTCLPTVVSSAFTAGKRVLAVLAIGEVGPGGALD